jgi:hypothetical protein
MFSAGYPQYRTSFVNADSTSENRGIVEFTSRFSLPGELVLADRNRAEFRFIKGQPFSTRYRNRLGVQVPSGAHVVIEPYILRQNDSRSTPPHVDALGITLNLYF